MPAWTKALVALACALAAAAVLPAVASADAGGSNALREQAALLDVGGSHSCKVLSSGSVRCWGEGQDGQLGYGNTNDIGDNEAPASGGPVNLGTERSATAVTVGDNHTCAILDNGNVSCWGLNAVGQLGYGNTTKIGDTESPGSVAPVNLGAGRTAIDISAGANHTCAVLDDGTVRCWGEGDSGRLGYGNTHDIGDGETPGSVGPVDLGAGRSATAISAGGAHTCAVLDDGTVRCWGEGDSGRLGYGNTHDIGDGETPGSVGPVSLGQAATAISAGGAHTCALLDTGAIRCWGEADHGRLGYAGTTDIGDTETPDAAGPVTVGGLRSGVSITAGAEHTCARLDNGNLRCWGRGAFGRLGYGNSNDIGDNETPGSVLAIDVGNGRLTVAVSAGGAHTCARLENGAVRCWGEGDSGRLGLANTTDVGDSAPPGSVGPVNVGSDPRLALARNVAAIAAGAEHTCALLDDGNVRCWGEGDAGRLGYGNTADIGDTEMPGTAGPVKLGAGRTATQITTGTEHTCALLDNGAVRCWGAGSVGRLGYANTTTIGDNEPADAVGTIDIGSGRSAIDISAGGNHTCAVLDNGNVRCWGSGADGRLGRGNTDTIGDGETPGSVSTVDLGSGRLAVDVETGAEHSCALLDDGTVRCWGDSGSGRLGYFGTLSPFHVGDNENPGSLGPVALGNEATQIELGTAHTCARLADGAVRCWGEGQFGRLGYGNQTDVSTPPGDVALGAGVKATSVSLGDSHTCARLGSGAVKCWGQANNGQLGYENTNVLLSPAAGTVNLGGTATRLASGSVHNCIVLDTRGVRCWGFGEGGRLGYGNSATVGDDEPPGLVGPADVIDDRPVAVDDFQTVDEDAIAVPLEVLLNDNDPDEGPRLILSTTQPANGTVAITGGGSGATYTPDPNYCNSTGGPLDTFTYTLNGGTFATVSMTVTCLAEDVPPTAVNDAATVAEGASATAINVLANDIDPDGGQKSILAASDPADGTVVVAAGGTGLTYKPDSGYCNSNGSGRDTFTYTLNGNSTATVTMTVTCEDSNPNPPDRTAPDTTITSKPEKKIKSKRKRVGVTYDFKASEDGASFECSLDSAAFADCQSPTLLQVKRGKHTFQVRAIDAVGNVDASPASHTFKVKKKKRRKKR